MLLERDPFSHIPSSKFIWLILKQHTSILTSSMVPPFPFVCFSLSSVRPVLRKHEVIVVAKWVASSVWNPIAGWMGPLQSSKTIYFTRGVNTPYFVLYILARFFLNNPSYKLMDQEFFRTSLGDKFGQMNIRDVCFVQLQCFVEVLSEILITFTIYYHFRWNTKQKHIPVKSWSLPFRVYSIHDFSTRINCRSWALGLDLI